MKRRFSKILGVGLTVALLTSLLMTAAPVSALTQPSVTLATDHDVISKVDAEYTISFNLGKELPDAYTLGASGGSNTAAWESDVSFVHTRNRPAKLYYHGVDGNAYVEFVPQAGITVSDLADIDGDPEWSFWYNLVAVATNGPLLELRFTSAENTDPDGAGHVDITVNTVESIFEEGAWTKVPVDGDSKAFFWGNEPLSGAFGTPDAGALSAIEATIEAQILADTTKVVDVADWELTRVRAEIGWVGNARTCYIDDITINGKTAGETITITFPSDTAVDPTIVATIVASPGWIDGVWEEKAGVTADVTFAGVGDTKRTVTATLGMGDQIGEAATVRIKITSGITNPSTAGSYPLTVATSAETTAKTSAAYEIKAPTIPGLPGVVSYYNTAGVLMGSKTGEGVIGTAITNSAEGYTIKIGPGTYTESPNTNDAKVTFVATGTAAETIIKGNWTIDNASITLDGLTLTGTVTIAATGDKATIKNCIINKKLLTTTETLVAYNTTPDGIGTITNCTFDTTKGTVVDTAIDINQLGLTVSGCSFLLDKGDTAVDIGANCTVKDCPSITGSGGIGVLATAGTATISGSTFDGLATALDIRGDDVTAKENIIQNSTGNAVVVSGGAKATITNNEIKDTVLNTAKDNYAVNVTGAVANIRVMFNKITGNTLNVKNAADTDVKLNATHNWWGDPAGPASTSISTSTTVDTSAYLGSSVSAVAINLKDSLDAKTTVGVAVTATGATTIAVAKYIGNPQEDIADALAFFDVYVAGTVDPTAKATIKFYVGDENTELYAWSADTDMWVKQTCSFSDYGGYVYVTIDPAMLAGTPFALVAGEAEVAELLAPTIDAPKSGADTVSLTPTFAWSAVPGADGYYFQFADNADFVPPLLAKLDGDLGRLGVTAYAYRTELPYSKAYYWRVKAVSGTAEAGDLAEGDWVSAVFTTIDEPVVEPEPEPEVWMCSEGLTFDSREALEAHLATAAAHQPVEAPDIIVPLPDVAAPITPGWIYVIIAVGGVLVIGLIVLIVRTRRVA